MPKKSPDVLRRSDRVLVAALSVVLAAVSAAVGAAAAYRPHTDQAQAVAAVTQQAAPSAPASMAAPEALQPASAVGSLPAAEQLVMNKLLAEHRCLSEALYYEARGEGTSGQKAIAEVIFTRMRTGNYGHSICAVVYEGANQPHCQFSFTCNGDLARRKQTVAWMRAQQLAARILTGEELLRGTTGGATNFHAVSVDPEWSYELARTVQIGNHVFYKDGGPHSRPM